MGINPRNTLSVIPAKSGMPTLVIAVLILGIVTTFPIYAQHAVRDEFPNGKLRGELYEHFTAGQWESSNFAPPDAIKAWEGLRYGMFIHFGITSKPENADLSWGSISSRYAPDSPGITANGKLRTGEWVNWPKDMKLEKFNAKEWVEIAQKAGFRYIVVCTKHHEGFHMWDTGFSDFKITNTPFGRDYIRELVDACHQAGMQVGFYFAQREWYHPDYQPVDLSKVKADGVHWTLNPGETSPLGPRHARYLGYLKNVVTELCTKYGKIDIWWFDAVSWDGMFTKEMWDSENITRLIRKLQPGIVINNRASLPGDFDTPEGRLGAFQDWRPWESCIPLSDAWCYTGKPAHSFDHLLHLLVGAACGNGNLLLSWGPHWNAQFDQDQKKRLFEIGDWLRINGKSIYSTSGGPWKPASWGGSTRYGNTAYIHLFNKPEGELILPSIPGLNILSARLLANGVPVPFTQNSRQISLAIPQNVTINGDLVLELTIDQSIDGIASIDADVPPDFHFTARVLNYNKNKVTGSLEFTFNKNESILEQTDATWRCERAIKTENNSTEMVSTFQLIKGTTTATGVSVNFTFDEWSSDNYVIMPGAVYDGNRHEVRKMLYPPMLKKEDYSVNPPITITDVPRLNKYPGESRLDLNTGDLSTPAIGIWFPKTGKGIWIFTDQYTSLGNSVLTLKENGDRSRLEFSIAAPCVREQVYGMMNLSESKETGADWKTGDQATIRCRYYLFDRLKSPSDLINLYPSIRKSFGTSVRIDQIPFSYAFEIMEEQQNRECWDEKSSFYSLGGEGWNMKWQLGWVGGCMITQPLSLIGTPQSKERSLRNYTKIITQSQAKSGFYYSCGNGNDWCSDCFWDPHPDNLLLLRKNADVLYYFYKYCQAQAAIHPGWEMPAEWKEPLRKFADAFVTLWNRYGQFGQFIDIETGEIRIGGSNSAAMAIGGLALAGKFENRPDLLTVAKEAARYYYQNFTEKGISCGGPSEILQNNDSESAFAMLESFMTLYEITGENEWLKDAEDAAAFVSTWMVSYDYRFPPASLFGKLDMHTTGSYWASTQNKHAGPGICTQSGDCLLKLYRATGNKLYLGMISDVAHNVMQYMSRNDRPVGDLPPGWINERVNMSDWEGKGQVGGIFRGNTWAQVSAMLSVAEIPGIYINPAKKELVIFDHVEASLIGNQLIIKNPTKFDASVRVFVDSNPSKPYPAGYMATLPQVPVRAGETKTVNLSNNEIITN
jgi:alpha-L-fucosidase